MTDDYLPFPDDLPRDPRSWWRTPASRSTRRWWRRPRRARGGARSGGCCATSRPSSRSAFLLLVLFAAVFAPLVAPHTPNEIRVRRRSRDRVWDTPFGTDNLGRDIFSRIVYGARVSLSSGFEIVFLALLAAVPIGLLAGFRGGGTDNVLMRVMDGLASFPPLVLALAVVGILGPGLENAILAIAIVVIPGFARLIRAQTLAVRQETFIEASQIDGDETRAGPPHARAAERRVAVDRRGVAGDGRRR